MEYEFEIRRNESRLQRELEGGIGYANNGLRPRQKLAGVDITAEIADGYDYRNEGESRRNYDIRGYENALGESAVDTRSGHREIVSDTEANVGNHDVRNIEVGSDGEGTVITGWETE